MKLFNIHKKANQISVKSKIVIGDVTLRDWKFMIIVFATLVILAVVFVGYLSVKINRGDFFVANSASEINPAMTGRKTLLDANNFFVERQAAYEAFKLQVIPEADPSL